MADKIARFLEEVKHIWISPLWELTRAKRDHGLKAVVLQWDNIVEDKHGRQVIPFTMINQADLNAYVSFVSNKVRMMASGPYPPEFVGEVDEAPDA